MSEDVRANIARYGVALPIVKSAIFQLDKISSSEAATYQGSDPHFTYKAFTVMIPLINPQYIQFRDYLIDQDIIDVLTGQLRRFLIVNEPEIHVMDGHWQFVCTKVRGT